MPREVEGILHCEAWARTLRQVYLIGLPLGSKDPNNRALGPKYYNNINGIWAIWAPKSCYLGPWTLRVKDPLRKEVLRKLANAIPANPKPLNCVKPVAGKGCFAYPALYDTLHPPPGHKASLENGE